MQIILFNTIFIPLGKYLTLCHYLQIKYNTLTCTPIGIDTLQNRAKNLNSLFYDFTA